MKYLLLILFLSTLFTNQSFARNEYLNNGSNECRYGDVDLSISKREREQDYHTYNSNDYDDDSHELRLSFRKYLGISKKHCDEQNRIRTQNETLKQQIELYKVCKGIRASEPLPQFAELIAYCNGTKPFETRDRVNPYKEMIESIK